MIKKGSDNLSYITLAQDYIAWKYTGFIDIQNLRWKI